MRHVQNNFFIVLLEMEQTHISFFIYLLLLVMHCNAQLLVKAVHFVAKGLCLGHNIQKKGLLHF